MTECQPGARLAPAQYRRPKRPVHGVLLLDKPVGLTSNAALQTARRLLQAEKAGHTGTLDPFADGLLPLCFGEASKFSSWQLEADKSYRAELMLGVTTTTGDPEGEVLSTAPVRVDIEQLQSVISEFVGQIDQVPPMYSALKVRGKPLYAYARAGLEVERKVRQIHIRSIEMLDFSSPRVVLDVRCSAGTYIRTLAEDIGQRLGCGAHLTRLTRLSSGGFELRDAVPLRTLETLDLPGRDALLKPADHLVAHLSRVDVDAETALALVRGQHPVVAPHDFPLVPCSLVRVYRVERFVGLVEWQPSGVMTPKRLMSAKLCLDQP